MTPVERDAITLFLDVDGVLCPYPCNSVDWTDWTDVTRDVRASRQMGGAIAALPLRKVWLTSWEEDANDVLCPFFGWDPLPVIRYEKAKRDHVLDHADGPFIWADDDASFDIATSYRHLVIKPALSVGLTREDIDRMRSFCSGQDQRP